MKGKALAIVAISLTLCLAIGSPLCFGAEPIKIAGIFALSGRAAHIGTAQRDAVLLAVDEVNAQGGDQWPDAGNGDGRYGEHAHKGGHGPEKGP